MAISGPTTAADEHDLVVAVVGCGRWGRNVVRDLVELDCRVVAVDVSEAARHDAQALGAATAGRDLRDYADRHRIDGVVVAAPTRLHARLGTEALELGVPVFVEKPFTDDVASAQSLVDLGSDRLFVMHKWHYHPGIEALAEVAASGRLGTVHGITSERVGEANPSDDTDVLWLLGPHEITIGARVHGSFQERAEAVVDVGDDGLVGADVIARWNDGRWHRWTISTRRERPGRRVVLHASQGHAVLSGAFADSIELHPNSSAGAADPLLVPVSAEFPLRRELTAFRDHLLGGPPPPTTATDGLAVVRAIAAVRESAGLAPSGSITQPGSAGRIAPDDER